MTLSTSFHTHRRPFMLAAAALVLGLATAWSAAVGTSNWFHTSDADWKPGTFENVVATNLGDLKLSRAVKTLLEQDPKVSSVNALAEGKDGSIYAGTGPHGVLLRVKGEEVTTLATLEDATNIFSLMVDSEGRLLIGTGGQSGRVLRIDDPVKAAAGEAKDVKLTEVFKAEGVQYVWQIRQTPDGNLYVATGPTGQLFEVKPDGTQKVLLDSDENNLTALASDGKDTLYVGTDPNGLVYRVNRKTGESFVLYDAPETEISALVLDAKGNLYAATAEARDEAGPGGAAGLPAAGEAGGRPEGGSTGVPIRSEPPKEPAPSKLPDPNPGRPEPIPKSNEGAGKEASSRIDLRPARSAGLLGSTLRARHGLHAPRVRLVAETHAEAGHPRPPTPGPNPGNPPPSGGRPTSQPSRPATPPRQPTVEVTPPEAKPEGNAVYKIDRDGFVTEIFRQPVLILSMVETGGTLLLATGNEGQIYQVSPSADETVVLAKVEPKEIMCLLPAKDGRVYMGMANVGGLAAMSSGYASSGVYTSPVLDAAQISRFGKIHLHGSLGGGTELKVSTRSGNVKDASEKGWSTWSDDAPATEYMQVKSPSARFLQYRFTLASKEGRETPVVEDVNIAYQVPNLPPVVKAVKVTAAIDLASPPLAMEQDAAPAPAVPPRQPPSHKLTINWDASDPNGDTLTYSIYFRREDGSKQAPWILLKDKLTEPTLEWDTRTVADGRYEIKAVASDAASNVPGMGLAATRVSDPITVDNTPPLIGDLKWSQKGAGVEVRFRAVDRTSVMAAAEFAVDSSKDWQAILPSDSIWDSPEETATFNVAGLTPGVHQVTIRASDAKGNQAFETVLVTVAAPTALK